MDAAASANGKRGREMWLAGRVADKAPTREDRKMVVEAVQSREAWENAMALMRERRGGWVHARVVSGKMVILLAQRFRVSGDVVEVLVGDEPEVAGAWVATAAAAAWGEDESEEGDLSKKRRRLRQKGKGKAAAGGVKLKEGDKGWRVQLVEGGAGGGTDVPVVRGLWKQHYQRTVTLRDATATEPNLTKLHLFVES